jgi:hypothetical protein
MCECKTFQWRSGMFYVNTLVERNMEDSVECSKVAGIFQQLGQAFLALLTESSEIL